MKEIETILVQINDVTWKEVGGLDKRLSYLDQRIEDAAKLVKEQEQIFKVTSPVDYMEGLSDSVYFTTGGHPVLQRKCYQCFIIGHILHRETFSKETLSLDCIKSFIQ